MEEVELSLRRSQMGRSTQGWVQHAGPRAVGELGAGHWLMLSGAPSPDVNMALVHDGVSATLADTQHTVETAGYPSLFMLAGRSQGADLGSGWQRAGAMPFMCSDIGGKHLDADPRVRRATDSDFDAVGDLLADAFGLTREVSDVCARLVQVEQDALRVWLLTEEGQPVSTVTTGIVDDVVCVWCMATPQRFGRRGYGRSLLAHVLLRAREQGTSIGLLGATPAGQPLYEATGWQTLEEWELFLNAESTQFAH